MSPRVLPLAVALATACASPGHSFDAQGHRGARGLLPENTLPGFARALELGVTTLELDVGLSADGAVVVNHEPWVDPKRCLASDGARIEGERGPLLRDLGREALRAFDCGSLNPDPEAFPEPPRVDLPGTPMPTLHEVFALVAARGGDVRLNVEIKAEPGDPDTRPLPEMVDATLAAIRRAGAVERTTLQSFHWRALALAKEREPGLRTAALVSPQNLDPAWLGGLDPDAHPDFLSLLRAAPYVDELSPWWRQLVPGRFHLGHTVGEFQAAGYRVVPWTVNEPERMREMIALGVDGLITDYPDRLVAEVERAGLVLAPPGDRN